MFIVRTGAQRPVFEAPETSTGCISRFSRCPDTLLYCRSFGLRFYSLNEKIRVVCFFSLVSHCHGVIQVATHKLRRCIDARIARRGCGLQIFFGFAHVRSPVDDQAQRLVVDLFWPLSGLSGRQSE